MADRVLRVGLTQWHPTRDPAANTATAVRMVHECTAAGAELVLLPENGLMLGTNTEMRDAALSVDSPEIAVLRQAAKEAGTVVVLGGFKRRGADGIRNTALVISASGGIVGGTTRSTCSTPASTATPSRRPASRPRATARCCSGSPAPPSA